MEGATTLRRQPLARTVYIKCTIIKTQDFFILFQILRIIYVYNFSCRFLSRSHGFHCG